jgi:hypothetical protein
MFSSSIKVLKGNTGMTLFGTRNDDSSVLLPDIGFDFMYNSVNVRSAINTSGNSWVGFGGAIEHLDINRRDASYNNLYYVNETENGKPIFRIRWEGQGYYNSWGANDLVWELILYNDNSMVLVMESTPKNGTDSFVSQGADGTIACNFQVGKSYAIIPTQPGGLSYTIQEGSYVQFVRKYLIDDGANGIKAWNGSTWGKVADAPVTEDIMKNNGTVTLSASRNGIILTNPALLMWTDDLSGISHHLKTTAAPTPKLIKQIIPYSTATGIKNVITDVNITGSSVIKVICSVDGGVSWKTWNGSSWIVVDTSTIANVKTSGMLPDAVAALISTQWLLLVGVEGDIQFGYYMEQVATNENCYIDRVRVNYN